MQGHKVQKVVRRVASGRVVYGFPVSVSLRSE